MDGLFDNALAIEVRCFCPPDTSAGYLSAISEIPNSDKSVFVLRSISFEGFPAIICGKKIFSRIVNPFSSKNLEIQKPNFDWRISASSFSLPVKIFCPSKMTQALSQISKKPYQNHSHYP